MVVVGSVVAVLVVGVGLWWWWRRPAWMGFTGKTLWDWVALVAVPLVIGIATVGLSLLQQHLADQRAEEEAVQVYLDRVSDLVLDPATDLEAAEVVAIGRAQTTAVLQVVDGEQAGRVVQFLGEAGLLATFVPSLEDRNLAGAELKDLSLADVDLEGTDLRDADLEGADLAGADLEATILVDADLKDADLAGAALPGADLTGADLAGADLRGADLSTARGLEPGQLATACLDDATVLPDGTTTPEDPSGTCALGSSEPDDEDDQDDDASAAAWEAVGRRPGQAL